MKQRIPFRFVILSVLVLGTLFAAYAYKTETPISVQPSPSPSHVQTPIQTTKLETYTSEKYGFEIQYPNTWQVSVDEEIPGIHIYKKADTKPDYLTHHTPFTHVSIYPDGIGTEGVQGETATTTVVFKEQVQQGFDYLLADGTRWGTLARFKYSPTSWKQWGYIWAGVKVENEKLYCKEEDGVLVEGFCEVGVEFVGSNTVRSGTINKEDRKIEEQILSSFRFIK